MKNFKRADESGNQETLMQWAELQADRMPELQHLYHIPNGGKRDAMTARAMKRQGVKAGVPDLCLPVARGRYHGLYIELKAGKNGATKNQMEWLGFLGREDYYAAICYGWRAAAWVLTEYLLYAGEKLKKGEKGEKGIPVYAEEEASGEVIGGA